MQSNLANIESSLVTSASLLSRLHHLLARLINIPPNLLDIDTPLLETGADSIVLLSAIREIETNYGIKVSTQQLFEELITTRLLAAYIDEQLSLFTSATQKKLITNGNHSDSLSPVLPTVQLSPPTAKTSESMDLAQMTQRLHLLSQQMELLLSKVSISSEHDQLSRIPSFHSQADNLGWQHKKAITSSSNLNTQQQQHLQALIQRLTQRTGGSKRYATQYQKVLADSKATVGFRLSTKELLYPIVGERTQGAYMWDIDGNQYLDMTMGFGVHLFGYRPDFLVQAMQNYTRSGLAIGPRSATVGKVAELISELTGMERVAFASSGTEAVMIALRLARAATGKMKYVIFKNSYHGHADFSLIEAQTIHAAGNRMPLTPGIPASLLSECLVLDYGSEQALEIIDQHSEELAAVLVEPIQSRNPELQPREFLQQLRTLTSHRGIALIFDEMLTGFRLHQGGAQAWFGVHCDIATYGKIIGGGMPIGIIAGSAHYLDRVDGGPWQYHDNSYPAVERTFFGGTYCQHALVLSMAYATLQEIKRQGPQLQQSLNDKTAQLATTLNDFFSNHHLPIRIVYWGSLFKFSFTANLDLLFYHLLEKGVYIWEWRNCFLSTAHTDADIAFFINAVKESVRELQDGGFLPGSTLDAVRVTDSLNYWQRHAQKPILHRKQAATLSITPTTHKRTMDFSVFYFGHYNAEYSAEKYQLLLESIRFADQHGFKAAWLPERHFHPFGGFSPNPAVLCAALARDTQQIQLRGGSVVLPLHHPVRVAEDWAVVDNLSGGRVGIAFASGWHPNDFVFNPQRFGKHREATLEDIATVQKLWRGESLEFMAGAGKIANIQIFPQPAQKELPSWLTIVNNSATYIQAGSIGVGVLTNLMGQTLDTLAKNIVLYRQALQDHGHEPQRGHVTVLLHTFIGEDLERTRQIAQAPFCHYLQTTLNLLKNIAVNQGVDVDWENIDAKDRDYLLSRVYQGYVENSALIGTPESCRPIVEKLLAIGVDEIACFLDFGIDADKVMASLPFLQSLKSHYSQAGDQPDPDCDFFPLTIAQQQLYRLSCNHDHPRGSLAYHILADLHVTGDFNFSALQQAAQRIVQRHESLRTTITAEGQQQCIRPYQQFTIPLLDFSELPIPQSQEKIQNYLNEDTHQPFDLTKGPLWRLVVLKQSEQKHVLAFTIHHILCDGFSVGIFFEELLVEYQSIFFQTTANLPAPQSFKNFISQGVTEAQTEGYMDHTSYWLEQLQQIPPRISLPFDFFRPLSRIHRAEQQSFTLNEDFCDSIRKLAAKQKCTLFAVLTAAFSAFLARITGQDELLLASPIAKRTLPGSEQVIGYCTNILPLHFIVDCHQSFTGFLEQAKTTLTAAITHPNYDFADLISSLSIDPGQFPLTNVLFNLERFDLPHVNGWQISYIPRCPAYIDHDLFINVVQIERVLRFNCNYSAELFQSSTMATFLESFSIFLRNVVVNPELKVASVPLLSDSAADYLLNQCNATKRILPKQPSLVDLFSEQVKKTPDAIAIVDANQTLSYKVLDEQSNQLAHYLLKLLKNRFDPKESERLLIGLAIPSSIDFIIAVLATIKIGGGYVPFEKTCPPERIQGHVVDARIPIVLSLQSQKSQLSQLCETLIVYMDELRIQIAQHPNQPVACQINGDHVVYVMYTSGSTGKPKGVIIEHRGVIRLIKNEDIIINGNDNIAQSSNIAFDVSAFEIWSALLTGAKLTILPANLLLAAENLSTFLDEQKITILTLTPAIFDLCVKIKPDMFKNLRYLIVCGDIVAPQSIQALFDCGYKPSHILNAYGPTENTVFTTLYEITQPVTHRSVPIGKPITNTSIYVLDRFMQPLPIGIKGELYTGGIGVARGYLNNPELTARSFVPNPFAQSAKESVATSDFFYKTGDMVRWLPTGELEFFGRSDAQVKINGYRVELAEIDYHLAQHSAILQNQVIVDEQHGIKRLIAFYCLKPSAQDVSSAQLSTFLAGKLPGYSLPNLYIKLPELPHNKNGKIDKLALQKYLSTVVTIETQPCSYEQTLQSIWEGVLGHNLINRQSHFYQNGGNSLFAAQLIDRINGHFQTNINFAWLISYPTIHQQALQLSERTQSNLSQAKKLLVPLKTTGKNPPLFFIHPARAGAEAYLECAQLFTDEQPFYAIDCHYDKRGWPHDNALETIAKQYVEAILAGKPQEVYFLGGWSLGGVFAYEMALQLTRLGKKVGGLYLIDSFLLNEPQRSQLRQLQSILAGHLPATVNITPDSHTRHTAELQLMLDYYPQSRWEKIHLMKASQKTYPRVEMTTAEQEAWLNYLEALHSQPDNGWHQVCNQIIVSEINGDHYSIMTGDCLKQVVNRISQDITNSLPLIS